jgi:imidazolonepropionase-like amidohydrolase
VEGRISEKERQINNGRTLIKGATVISVDPEIGDLPKGDVLFEGGKIAEVAPDVKAPDAEVIDATDKIVMPGLVDAHHGALVGVDPEKVRRLAVESRDRLFGKAGVEVGAI